ncbi:MAG: type II toxin-antitoxin system VapB family antitoxin [bacterium]|nr:type II toxin-antitoxin system VapB family antitoxin [bacterium]
MYNEVYHCAAMRTNVDLDDELVAEAMARYGLRTKRDAVNFALKQLLGEPMGVEDALGMEGSGWEGDLDELRSSRVAGSG